MAKKDWGTRWGEDTSEGVMKWHHRESDLSSLTNYLKCGAEGKQCLLITNQLISMIKTRIMLGSTEFDITKQSGYPRAMLKGDPRIMITIANKCVSAYYKGKGKWKIIVG